MKCNYYTRKYQRYYTCRGSGLTEQNGFHGQKLLGLLAAILDAIQFLGLATAIAIMTLAYIENIHFLFFFFFLNIVYIHIYFSRSLVSFVTCGEKLLGWEGIEVSVWLSKNRCVRKRPSHRYLVFPRWRISMKPCLVLIVTMKFLFDFLVRNRIRYFSPPCLHNACFSPRVSHTCVEKLAKILFTSMYIHIPNHLIIN